jgi:hypothetical protein
VSMADFLQFIGFMCGLMGSVTAVVLTAMVCFWAIRTAGLRLFDWQ